MVLTGKLMHVQSNPIVITIDGENGLIVRKHVEVVQEQDPDLVKVGTRFLRIHSIFTDAN